MLPNTYITAGQFTTGPNNSITIYETATNLEVDWGLVTQVNWDSSTVTERRPVPLMSGIKLDLIFYQGWRCDFTIQRTNSNLDVYWSNIEAQVRAGAPMPTWTIIQRIQETDGTITELTFPECGITYDAAGTFANEEGVMQKVSVTAPARLVEKV
jgi:hypothetical protein